MNESVPILRSKVIESFINLECLVNAIITQHYFKRGYLPFLLEVLYDENCSFALKRNVLLKIVKDFDENIKNDLYRLNTIRNIFAHCGPEISPINESGGRVPNPRKLEEEINFLKLHDEFMQKESKVIGYLFNIAQQIGAQFIEGDTINARSHP